MCCTINVGYWCADNDFGELFLNFWLHPDLREYCGVNISHLYLEDWSENKDNPMTGVSTRPAMGLRVSPYQAVLGALRAKRVALGDRHDNENVFAWSSVEMNLPGSFGFDPARSWISKRRADGRIASDIHLYADDNCEIFTIAARYLSISARSTQFAAAAITGSSLTSVTIPVLVVSAASCVVILVRTSVTVITTTKCFYVFCCSGLLSAVLPLLLLFLSFHRCSCSLASSTELSPDIPPTIDLLLVDDSFLLPVAFATFAIDAIYYFLPFHGLLVGFLLFGPWGKSKARGMRPGKGMMEHSSYAKASVKMLIRFSQGL